MYVFNRSMFNMFKKYFILNVFLQGKEGTEGMVGPPGFAGCNGTKVRHYQWHAF